MTVVATDSHYVEPFVVKRLYIYSGETYSVLVTANQNQSINYWAMTKMVARNNTTPNGLAIFNYIPNPPTKIPPTVPPRGPSWNDLESRINQSLAIKAHPDHIHPMPKTPDRVIILLNTQNLVNGYRKWAINNVSLTLPVTPYLVSLKYNLSDFDPTPVPDIMEGYDNYNISTIALNPNATSSSSLYRLKFNTTIDIILQNANSTMANFSETHPWHLHGHNFWVLGYGSGEFNAAKDPKKYNLVNPIKKNTVPLHPFGWTALRFIADNPGVWAFHCHIEAHLFLGMGVVFAEECLYGTIDEEVYVSQPPGFVDSMFPNKIYNVVKALYGLHQAPRARVKTASTPIETQKPLVKDEEAADVDVLGYSKDFTSSSCEENLRYLKGQPKLGLWYPKVSSFDLKAYLECDYAGANLDKKSTTGDYGFNFMNTKIYINNERTIYTVKNPVFQSKTKHIEIRHHFIRGAYEKKLIQVLKIHTDDNVADLLTKASDVSSKELASPKQTTLGKDISNPLIAGRLPKTTFPTRMEARSVMLSQQVLQSVHHASCIKQFWTTAKVKTINDEVRIQALIDEKRINIKEPSIRRTLKLDDAEGTSCFANTEIFDGLAKMGYEKQSEKLTFYKAFFSPKWNTMASVVICLATNQKVNFSRYILLSLVKKIEAGVLFFMFPSVCRYEEGWYWFLWVVTALFDNMLVPVANEVGLIQYDLQSITIPTEPSTAKPHKKHKTKKQQTQAPKVPSPEPSPEHMLPSPSNDPLPGGKDSIKLKELIDLCTHLSNKVLELESEVIGIKSTYKDGIEKLEGRVDTLDEENRVLKDLHIVYSKVDTVAPVAKPYRMDLEHQEKVLSMQVVDDEEPTEVEKVLELVKAAKRKSGVVIQDPEETTSRVVVHLEVHSKDKEKGILIEEPKSLKGQAQIEQHEAFSRQLEAEFNADINWNAVM
nr:L-ascorbate oxidase [Tanacetum cinerariifolium]